MPHGFASRWPNQRSAARAALALVVVAASGIPAVAAAHERVDLAEKAVYVGDPDVGRCVQSQARTEHGTYNHGLTRATTEFHLFFIPGNACSVNEAYKDPGKIAVKFTWLAFRPRTETWYICLDTDWTYNMTRTWSFSLYHDWRSAECGAHDYLTHAQSSVHIDGEWRSLSVDNTRHYFD